MAKPTLLKLTQDILVELNGDQVNSISDTQESSDIADIVVRVHDELIDELELPSNRKLIVLEGIADLTKPNYLRLPENVERMEWLKYDIRPTLTSNADYYDIHYLSPYDFVTHCAARPELDTTNYQIVYEAATVKLIIGKQDRPAYWTSFDDKYIVLDSYDLDVDSTLQGSKTLAEALVRPVLVKADASIPELPENLFNILYVQALNRCYSSLRQTINPKTERVESRFRVRTQRNKHRSRREVMDWPDYGRRC